MKMIKPNKIDQLYYNWDTFAQYAEKHGINLKFVEDYLPWWECWKAGHNSNDIM